MRISDWSSDVCSSDLSDAGLVLLTAAARREDRVLALSLGVDHYLVKPDDHHELEMVIRNLHRRLRGAARDLEPARPRQWMFDAARWSITPPTGAISTLSLADYTRSVDPCYGKACCSPC